MMEHLGVRVIEDQTYAARDKSWFIHDFRLELPFEHAPLRTGGIYGKRRSWRYGMARRE